MGFLADLWFPVILAAVLVFVASSILHMFLPIHKGDYRKLAGEDQVLETMRGTGVTPGTYMFPCPSSMKDMATPEMIEKFKQGPVGHLTVVPSGPPGMGKNLVQWFLYSVLVSVFVAYLTWNALMPGAEYLAVFRISGTIAVLAYGVAALPDSIWKGTPWRITAKFVFDGVVYGLVTAGAFAGFWPGA
ncbi:MAG: hypothetical protein ACYTG3_10370 [Planctomycetota bacterium]|jgi:hypothetical protein